MFATMHTIDATHQLMRIRSHVRDNDYPSSHIQGNKVYLIRIKRKEKERKKTISCDGEFFASNDGSERVENISRNWGYFASDIGENKTAYSLTLHHYSK